MTTAYLGLGSNLGDREAALNAAIAALGRAGKVTARSAFVDTAPEGGARQPRYLNAAVRIETRLAPRDLLKLCLRIEHDLGRRRRAGRPGASRIIDIDLLLHGDRTVDEPGLEIPHPRLLGRPFVRIPLAEVALPGLRHPVSGERLDRSTPDPSVRPTGDLGAERALPGLPGQMPRGTRVRRMLRTRR